MLIYVKEVRNKLREINDCKEDVSYLIYTEDELKTLPQQDRVMCHLERPCEKCQERLVTILMWAAEDWED